MLNTCFPSRSLEFWSVRGRGCLRDQPNKKPRKGGWNELLPSAAFYPCCHSPLLGEVRCILCDSVGRGPLRPRGRSPHISPYPPLPTAEFALYPVSVTELNHMLSPVSLLRNLLNLLGILGTPETHTCINFKKYI